ncbi:MAG: DUF2927 domain-containing protein [Pseudomonadota bacterium]
MLRKRFLLLRRTRRTHPHDRFTRAGGVRRATARLVALAMLMLAPSAAATQADLSDALLTDGFFRTVFGLEYESFGRGASVVKKFSDTVFLYIDQRARQDRRQEVRAFVQSVNRSVQGLDLRITENPADANFTVFIVDRAHYADTIRGDVYRSSSARVRGRCMVRVLTQRNGIERAQAVIVSDEGEFLFNRCLVEEVLQGLGPLNDDASLALSVFNDQSRHTRFTLHDRFILNMLYHPGIRAGMDRRAVERTLPRVLSDVRRYVP